MFCLRHGQSECDIDYRRGLGQTGADKRIRITPIVIRITIGYSSIIAIIPIATHIQGMGQYDAPDWFHLTVQVDGFIVFYCTVMFIVTVTIDTTFVIVPLSVSHS